METANVSQEPRTAHCSLIKGPRNEREGIRKDDPRFKKKGQKERQREACKLGIETRTGKTTESTKQAMALEVNIRVKGK